MSRIRRFLLVVLADPDTLRRAVLHNNPEDAKLLAAFGITSTDLRAIHRDRVRRYYGALFSVGVAQGPGQAPGRKSDAP